MLHKLGCVLLFALTLLVARGGAQTRAPEAAGAAERQAVERAVRERLGRETPDNVRIDRFKISSLDIRSGWALASVEPEGDAAFDPVSLLLRRQRGRWKVLTLGTSLMGTGRTYRVPRSLWRRWGLG